MTTWVPVEPAPAVAPGLDALAPLFEYPRADFAERLGAARAVLADRNDESGRAAFESFARDILALDPESREELHAATFEITPACVPYVSLHLFGEESFKRGAFMAALNARYAATGFTVSGELPDHLVVLLRFAATTDEVECRELAEFCLLGPLDKMMTGLAEGNPYRALLEATRCRVQALFPGVEPAVAPVDLGRRPGESCGSGDGCGCEAPPSGAMASPGASGPTFQAEVEDD